MKTISMVALFVGVIAIASMPAQGSLFSITQVTGADSANGLMIPGSSSNTEVGGITIVGDGANGLGGWNSYTPAPSALTLQGYTYAPYYDVWSGSSAYAGPTVSHFALSGPQAYENSNVFLPANNGGVPTLTGAGASASDNAALQALVNNGLLYRQVAKSTNTLTVSGLTPGNTYTLDILASWIGYGLSEDETFSVRGVSGSQTLAGGNNTSIYDIQYTGTPDASGKITVDVTSLQMAGPNFNAAIVTEETVPVPEPATMAFLLLGGLSMAGAALRRRNHGKKISD